MKVTPIGGNILLKRLEAEDKSKGGIVLPETAKEKPQKGKVISLGDGKITDDGNRSKFQVKEGDMVIFASYAGNELKVEGEDYLILRESDVLAKL